MKNPPVQLRERKKDATRRALIKSANRLFQVAGFEATTIDEVCQDAGISRRTFFRYFPDKETLAFPHRDERLQRFIDLLGNAPDAR
ncbi:MAG: TetR family transcriptional regulator, partial [Arenimonas sp.]